MQLGDIQIIPDTLGEGLTDFTCTFLLFKWFVVKSNVWEHALALKDTFSVHSCSCKSMRLNDGFFKCHIDVVVWKVPIIYHV